MTFHRITRASAAAILAVMLAMSSGCTASRDWAVAHQLEGPCFQPQDRFDAIVNCPAQVIDTAVLLPIFAIDVAHQLEREHTCRALLADAEQRHSAPTRSEQVDQLLCRRTVEQGERRSLLQRTDRGC